MLPERGEGCRCKGKTPKTFMCVCVYNTNYVARNYNFDNTKDHSTTKYIIT